MLDKWWHGGQVGRRRRRVEVLLGRMVVSSCLGRRTGAWSSVGAAGLLGEENMHELGEESGHSNVLLEEEDASMQ